MNIQKEVLKKFKQPLRYDNEVQRIFDADNRLVVDVRAWGYLSSTIKNQQLAMQIQDELGEMIAKAFNHCYSKPNSINTVLYGEGLKENQTIPRTEDDLNGANVMRILYGPNEPFGSEGMAQNVSDGLELADWILKHKRSVFLEADISHDVKKDILKKLGYSSDILN